MASGERRPNFKTTLCDHFKRGSCRRGSDCTYAHGEDHPAGSGGGQKDRVCKLFMEGNCYRGDRCKFLHQIDDEEGSSSSETSPGRSLKVDGFDLEEIASQELFAASSSVGGFSDDPNSSKFEVGETQLRLMDWDAVDSLCEEEALDDNYEEESVKETFDAREEYNASRRLQDLLQWFCKAPGAAAEGSSAVFVLQRDLLTRLLKYSLYPKDPDWKIVAVKRDRFIFLEEKYESKDRMDYRGWYCSERLRERVTCSAGLGPAGDSSAGGSYQRVDCKTLTSESFQLWVVGVSHGFDRVKDGEYVPYMVKNLERKPGKETDLSKLKAETLFFEAVCMGAQKVLMTYRRDGKLLGSPETWQVHELLAGLHDRAQRMGQASTFLRRTLRWMLEHLGGSSTQPACIFESRRKDGARCIVVQEHLTAWAKEIMESICSSVECGIGDTPQSGQGGSDDAPFTVVQRKGRTRAAAVAASAAARTAQGAAVALSDDEESPPKKGVCDDQKSSGSGAKPLAKVESNKITATVVVVSEGDSSVRLRLASGEYRRVDIESFTETWTMLPRIHDEVEFAESRARRINPKLSKISGRMKLEEMATFLSNLEERGHVAMLDVVTYNMLYLDHVLQYLEYSSSGRGRESLNSLIRLAKSLSGPTQASSSCSEAQVLRKIFESRYWMQTLPRAVEARRVDGSTVKQVMDFVQDVVVGALPRQVYHSRPLIESCIRFHMQDPLKSTDVINDLLSIVVALSSCFAVDAGHTKFVPWKQLPLVPKILSEDLTDVRDLPKVKSEYDSFEDYMDTYFRLLRADCFGPLQDGVKSFVQETLDPRDLRVYHANLTGIQSTRNSKNFVAAIECQNYHRTGKVRFAPRSLMQSNLVCLSIGATPFSDVLWGRVVDRPEKDKSLKNDKLAVVIEFLEELNSKKPYELLTALLTPEGPMLLADNPVFYVSFGPVLRRLKAMTTETLPFGSLLLARAQDADEAHEELPWTDDCLESLDVAIETGERVFDPAQDEALRIMLSSTVSTIQGPPGTGKSFIAVEATRHILQSNRRHRRAPDIFPHSIVDWDSDESSHHCDLEEDLEEEKLRVLLLAEKNHALDESLLDVMKANPSARVVRIGGRCENPALAEKTLLHLSRERKKARHVGARLHETITERDGYVQQLAEGMRELMPGMSPAFLLCAHASKGQLLSLMAGCKNKKRSHLLAHRRMQHALESGEMVCQEDLHDCCQLWEPAQEEAPVAASKRSSTVPEEEESDEEAGIEVKERKALMEGAASAFKPTNLIKLGSSSSTKVPLFGPLSGKAEGSAAFLCDQNDLWALSNRDRSRLLGLFFRRVLREQREEGFVDETLQRIEQLTEEIASLEREHKAEILRKADVVACTISGASIQCELLADIDFSVVIVEEAAEILEPQLVAALPPSCRQLMMIGDPYQLRPKIQTYRLRKDLNFDQSLMERLLTSKHGYPQVMLRTQNRMRNEFLCMLQPHYPDLVTNFERVANNKPLDFVRKTMFFVNSPQNYESASEVGRSVINRGEAASIVQFVEHIVREAIAQKDITVLAMYDGQTAHLRKILREKDYPEVVVSTVDRYQGDENKIVLVSLVRSNNEGKIGFVYERNRLIVAASRARSGVYFFGNGDLLEAKSTDWRQLIGSLKERGCYGPKLPVCCPRHSDVDLEIGQRCHHICKMKLEGCDHDCMEPCHPRGMHPPCSQEVVVELACTHKKACKCHQAQNRDLLVCNEIIDFEHAVCRHKDKRKCSSKEKPCKERAMLQCSQCKEWGETDCNTKHFAPEKFCCQTPCKRLMSCGHPCTRLCHQVCDMGMDDCELCEKARESAREEKLQEVKRLLESMSKEDHFSLGELRRDGAEWRFRDLENQVQSYFIGKQLKASVLSIEEVTNNTLKRRYLQRQDSVLGASSESEKTCFLEMPSREKAVKAAREGLADALAGPSDRTGKKQTGRMVPASFCDFLDETNLKPEDVSRPVTRHLLACKVQQGRVYQIGCSGHRKSFEVKVPKDFDSMYCPETRTLRLDQLTLALPTFVISVEVARSAEDAGSLPAHWTSTAGAGSWSIVPLPSGSKESQALARALHPRGALGGKDLHGPVDFRDFEMAQVWRLEHPGLLSTFKGRKKFVKDMLVDLAAQHNFKPRRVEVAREYQALDEALPAELDPEVNEVWLSHGTKPDTLLPILSQGVNERYSGGLFGNGTYFAEDVGKNNHYVAEDRSLNPSQELHRRLFTDSRTPHPGSIFYVLFCRVVLGAPIRTLDGESDMDARDRASIWSSEARELAFMKLPSGSRSTSVHHSLLAELGGKIHQYREFMVYNSSQVYPEYLVAYKRLRK